MAAYKSFMSAPHMNQIWCVCAIYYILSSEVSCYQRAHVVCLLPDFNLNSLTQVHFEEKMLNNCL